MFQVSPASHSANRPPAKASGRVSDDDHDLAPAPQGEVEQAHHEGQGSRDGDPAAAAGSPGPPRSSRPASTTVPLGRAKPFRAFSMRSRGAAEVARGADVEAQTPLGRLAPDHARRAGLLEPGHLTQLDHAAILEHQRQPLEGLGAGAAIVGEAHHALDALGAVEAGRGLEALEGRLEVFAISSRGTSRRRRASSSGTTVHFGRGPPRSGVMDATPATLRQRLLDLGELAPAEPPGPGGRA